MINNDRDNKKYLQKKKQSASIHLTNTDVLHKRASEVIYKTAKIYLDNTFANK